MTLQSLAAGFIVLAIVALFACALLPDSDEKQRKEELAEARKRKLERAQLDKAAAMKLDGTHLYQQRCYKPSSAYIAPKRSERPIPQNVAQLRRKK